MAEVKMTGKEFAELIRKQDKAIEMAEEWLSIALPAFIPDIRENNDYTYPNGVASRDLPQSVKDFIRTEIIDELMSVSEEKLKVLVRNQLYYYSFENRDYRTWQGAEGFDIREFDPLATRLAEVQKHIEEELMTEGPSGDDAECPDKYDDTEEAHNEEA